MIAWALSFGCADPVERVVLADRILPGGGPAAVAVSNGRIVGVTAIDDAPDALEVVSCALLTAGVVDAHAHPIGIARTRLELDLSDTTTYAEVLDRVASAPGTGWIVGRGWDHEDWPDAPEGGWPRIEDLDARTPGRPVMLRRVDGHAAWVDHEALATASGSLDVDPIGGAVHRDARGRPTGVLIDAAMDLVTPPPPSADALRVSLRGVLADLQRVGMTGVHEMGVDDAGVALWATLAWSDLPIRVWLYVDPGTTAAERVVLAGPFSLGPRVEVVGVKLYADGSLGSRGAWLGGDYADRPGHRGSSIVAPAEIERWAERAATSGAQIATHAIGDVAVHATISAYAAAAARVPPRAPMRVEHAQIVGPGDRGRFVAHGVVASMQPTHLTSDMPWAVDRLGPLRVPWGYAWKEILGTGATLAFGSDAPVETYDPRVGLGVALTRADPRTGVAYAPGLALTADEAITAYTAGAAAALGLPEGRLGRISRGASADLTCWAADPGPWPWRAERTWVGEPSADLRFTLAQLDLLR